VIGQRFVHQQKAPVLVFGKDEAGVEIDHLPQEVALSFQPILGDLAIGDVGRHAEQLHRLAIGGQQRHLDRLVPARLAGDHVGERLFRDELGLARAHHFEIVAVEVIRFALQRVEVLVQLADHLLRRGAIVIGQRFVHQQKAPVLVFGKDEAGVEIDHLPQEVALSFQPILGDLAIGDVGRHAEQLHRLAIGGQQRHLDRLVPARLAGDHVGERLFGDKLGLARAHHFEIVAVEVLGFALQWVEVLIQATYHRVGRGAIGIGQRFVGQQKASVLVFGKDEAGVEIDHLPQEIVLGLERILGLLAVGDDLRVDDQPADVALGGAPGHNLAPQPLHRAIRPCERHLVVAVRIALQAALVNRLPVGVDLLKQVVMAVSNDAAPLQAKIRHPAVIHEQVAHLAVEDGHRHWDVAGKLFKLVLLFGEVQVNHGGPSKTAPAGRTIWDDSLE